MATYCWDITPFIHTFNFIDGKITLVVSVKHQQLMETIDYTDHMHVFVIHVHMVNVGAFV